MIKSVEYLRHEDTITAYVVTEETTIATAVLNSKMYEDTNNQREPFEYLQHTFDFDMSTLSSCGEFTVNDSKWNYLPNGQTVHFDTKK